MTTLRQYHDMLLTITTRHQPATDLGYLLHKNPERFQTFDLSFGQAHVFYPQADTDRCTAALLVEVDPIQLVRGKSDGDTFSLQQYVNDRPYAASSFLSVAIAQVFGTALGGRSKSRAELAETPIPLEARIAAVPVRGRGATAAGEELIRRLFAPLGYEIRATRGLVDDRFPEWGESPYFDVDLSGTVRLRDLLSHIYVLVPVLDDDKHYWVGQDEIDKLLRHGREWLAMHPERNLIANRYLARQRTLTNEALARLNEGEDDADQTEEVYAREEEVVEERIGGPITAGSLTVAGHNLHEQRHRAVLAALRDGEANVVVDLGCGEGRLLETLLADRSFERIAGMDVSYRTLQRAAQRLHLDRMPERQRERISLIHGSLTYRDRRLEGFDAATVVEVIEHLDPARLAAFERVVFEFARPATVVLTTPNVEYNVAWESLPGGAFRHRDHRFEWTRAEFQAWAATVAKRFRYAVRFLPVGPEHPELGPPTQMAVFTSLPVTGRQ
jgi:3' terminal RNA ribose 2'-O-methyltransferase Hen1